MKRLIGAVLVLSLLGGTAAVASPYGHGDRGYAGGYGYQSRGNSNGAAIAAGFGILALGLLASQNHSHYNQGWYDRDGRGYNGYSRDGNDYHDSRSGYGDRYSGYGYHGR